MCLCQTMKVSGNGDVTPRIFIFFTIVTFMYSIVMFMYSYCVSCANWHSPATPT